MKTRFAGLLTDYFQNAKKDMTPGAFRKWFLSKGTTPQSDRELRALWKASSRATCERETVSSAFAKVCEAIGQSVPVARPALFMRTMHYLTRAAAILFLPLAGVSLYLYMNNKPAEINWIEVYADYGERKELILPDQSKIWLNSGTRVLYPTAFTNVRQIFVSGETFLDVTKDPARPFIVDTRKLRICVHGTKFNVRSYTEDKSAEATLLEGSISLKVKGKEEKPAIYLVPGEKAVLEQEQVKIEPFDPDAYRSWRSGRYTFRNKTLQEIATELQRIFDVRIVIRDKDLREENYFVVFAQGLSLDEMLEALDIDDRLTIRRAQDVIEISRKEK